MRYSLVPRLACQACKAPLACFTVTEQEARWPDSLFEGGPRVGAGPGMGPAPVWTERGPLAEIVDRHATAAAAPERGLQVVVATGVLLCGGCGRWYPVLDRVPEILPDHLREADRERGFLYAIAGALPPEIHAALASRLSAAGAAADTGLSYKRAEMSLRDKVTDPQFFDPGYTAPFNPADVAFTTYLLTLYGAAVPLLELSRGMTVIDSGCGYAWTTEWLWRCGIDAIGIDICRTYVDIAIRRTGPLAPHLVVADVENLPLLDEAADAVLAFESFHHVPNRPAAMREYGRVLKAGGRVVLAEPGKEHEAAAVSREVMERFGILERGMELTDVRGYADGTGLGEPEQIYVTQPNRAAFGRPFDEQFAKEFALVVGNLFRLRKPGPTAAAAAELEPAETVAPPPRGLRRLIASLRAAHGVSSGGQ